MLYIFYVDFGRRLTFDMRLLNEPVQHLKTSIEQYYGIPVSKQVLLVSGGECLEDTAKVCWYSAGTDTNPIYLFNRSLLEQRPQTPWVTTDFKAINVADNELNQMFDAVYSCSTPITIFTINKISQLAQKYYEQASEMLSFCDQLNIDQLLQQQGWAAAIANLDDVLINFKAQCEAFDAAYMRYLENRQEHIELINRFADDLNLLSRIPLLPALLDINEEEKARIESRRNRSDSSEISLLEWISAKDPEQSLENLIDICRTALEKYDEYGLETMRNDINSLVNTEKIRELHNMSEITDKLMILSGLIVTIKDTFEDQKKKASGIKRNHERAVDVNDDSILPDLFVTHKNTIQSMKSNHINLRSCRHLCNQSKAELCEIIHNRLKAVMTIQERVAEIRSMLVLHGANMRRLKEYIELIQQLHSTPRNYFNAVSEVVRRRSYSQAFLMWASDLACRIFTIYTEETERRKKFQAQFEGHFLNCLFPGLEDMPPSFATQSPPLFDNNLPTLCEDDLKQLLQSLPELEQSIDMPDVEAIRKFFLSKSITLSAASTDDDDQLNQSVNDKLAVVMSAAGITTSFHQRNAAIISQDVQEITSTDDNDDKGEAMMESTTGNEEVHKEQENASNKHEESTSLTESQQRKNIDIVEHERALQTMRDGMAMLGTVAHNAVISLRNDLSFLRGWVLTHQSDAVVVIQKLHSQNQLLQYRVKNFLQALAEKDDRIKSLYVKISCMENELSERLEETAGRSEEADSRLQEELRKERDRVTKEVTERLTREHKKEIETLRSRFKLMTCTNMERTSSDSSLEKIERGELIELANHEALMDQLKADMNIKLEKAIADERAACELKLSDQLRNFTIKFEDEKEELAKRVKKQILRECDKQITMMKNKEDMLLCELQKHKETIHILSSSERGSYSLLTKIEDLEREKNRVETELIKERMTKYSSFSPCPSPSGSNLSAVYSGDSGGSNTSLASCSSPELSSRSRDRSSHKKSRSSSYSTQGKVCISSCKSGDPVLVVWDEVQKNYTILQESPTPHIVHPSSIDSLGLKPITDGSPRKFFCPAEVINKELCCISKKTSSRYNFKEGEQFYRVRVKPLLPHQKLNL